MRRPCGRMNGARDRTDGLHFSQDVFRSGRAGEGIGHLCHQLFHRLIQNIRDLVELRFGHDHGRANKKVVAIDAATGSA